MKDSETTASDGTGSRERSDNELIADWMGVETEKEYYLTEWSTDHARTGWWKHSAVMFDGGFNNGSHLIKDWHADVHDIRTWAPAYDKDWNLLMPVVEKIETMPDKDFTFQIHSFRGHDKKGNLLPPNYMARVLDWVGEDIVGTTKKGSSKIETVYQAVVGFIKWYNNQKQQSS